MYSEQLTSTRTLQHQMSYLSVCDRAGLHSTLPFLHTSSLICIHRLSMATASRWAGRPTSTLPLANTSNKSFCNWSRRGYFPWHAHSLIRGRVRMRWTVDSGRSGWGNSSLTSRQESVSAGQCPVASYGERGGLVDRLARLNILICTRLLPV